MRQAVDDGGLDEVAVPERLVGDAAASGQQPAAVCRGARDRGLEGPHRRLVDDGTEIDVAIKRIADSDLLRLRDQCLDKPIPHVAVHEHARAGGTLLALRAERRAHHAVAGLVEIGRRHHDRRDSCRPSR